MAAILLGEFLLEKGFITKGQLEEALQTQRVFAGKKLGELLVERNILTSESLEQALTMQQTLRGQVQEIVPQEKAGLLTQIQLLKELAPEEIQELTGLCRVETFERGHLIFVEGEESGSVYFLAEGAVRLVKSNPRGGEEELAVLSSGETFGETDLLSEGPRSLTAMVQMNCTAVVLGRKELEELQERNPRLGLKILKILARNVARYLLESEAKLLEATVQLKSSRGFI